MNTDKVWIVVVLVIGIVVLANLAMFAVVRGFRSSNMDWFKNMRGSYDQTFKEDESLGELRKRVDDLKKPEEKED